MQHFQAECFSEEVSIPAAAPRRPSTNHRYDERWFGFARPLLGYSATQIASFLDSLFRTHGLTAQMAKGYSSSQASVLSCTWQWLCGA